MHAVKFSGRLMAFVVAGVGAWMGSLSDGVAWAAPKTSCTLDGTSVMAFGTYDPMGNVDVDAQGQVSYRCGNGNNVRGGGIGKGRLVVQISLSAGNAGNFQRYMQGPRDRMNYNLYMDAPRSQIWGDGTGGTRIYSEKAQPNNHVTTVPVFGRITGAQDVSVGQYLDNLVVTLNY